jgi:hypothetical protein
MSRPPLSPRYDLKTKGVTVFVQFTIELIALAEFITSCRVNHKLPDWQRYSRELEEHK